MFGAPPPTGDRRVTWQSVTAGVVLNAAFLAILVAVSHPVATGLVLAAGGGLYALRGVLGRLTYERTLAVCRPGVCVQVQLRVG